MCTVFTLSEVAKLNVLKSERMHSKFSRFLSVLLMNTVLTQTSARGKLSCSQLEKKIVGCGEITQKNQDRLAKMK